MSYCRVCLVAVALAAVVGGGCAEAPGGAGWGEASPDGGAQSGEQEMLRLDAPDRCVGGRGGFMADLMCAAGIDMTLPYGSDLFTIGIVFDVPEDGADRFDELIRPLCAPSRRMAAFRIHRMEDTPLAGFVAHESWIDLKASQFGVEGWRNQGMFIPEEVRWFYEPTAGLGGWKKQYVSETRWEQTADGWSATNLVNGQLFTRLEFRRGDIPADMPSHLRAYLEQPLDLEDHREPDYILQPADFDPSLYERIDPVVYDSRWTPLGPVDEHVEVGTVRLTWERPSGTDFDLRWMDVLPPSGSELPGYFVHKVPEPDTTEQQFTHRSTGYGECAPWR